MFQGFARLVRGGLAECFNGDSHLIADQGRGDVGANAEGGTRQSTGSGEAGGLSAICRVAANLVERDRMADEARRNLAMEADPLPEISLEVS